jgi:hypothetical protein
MRFTWLAVFLLMLSCSDPVCACSPRPNAIVLQGTLQSATGVPQPGKRVRAEVAVATCTTYLDSYANNVTDAAGGLRLEIETPRVDSICVRLFARDTTAGAPEFPLVGPLRVPGGSPRVETVAVSLVLPP